MIKNEQERKYREAMADAVAGLITEETGFATTQRKPFADGCHVCGALTEEWKESNVHIKALETLVDEFTDNCLSGDMPSEINTREHLDAIILHCKKLIMEITQVAAVSAKAGLTLGDWINE